MQVRTIAPGHEDKIHGGDLPVLRVTTTRSHNPALGPKWKSTWCGRPPSTEGSGSDRGAMVELT